MGAPPPDDAGAWRARVGLALLWLALLGLAVAVFAAGGGSMGFSLGPLRVSIRNPTNPALGAILAGFLGYRLLGPRTASLQLDRIDRALTAVGPVIAAAFAAFALAATIAAGVFVAGGSDSSGYLSEARLFQSRRLVQTPRQAASGPLANGIQVWIPLGYRANAAGSEMVPVYPPGLPLLMAILGSAGGEGAKYLVVPVCAAGLVIVAYVFGRRIGGPQLGALSAAATAVSPIVLFQGVLPMSDVPAAFWWTLAFVLLTFESMAAAVAAGLAAAVAGLIRPNLFAMVPVAALLAAWFEGQWRRGLQRAAGFALPAAAVALAFSAWQRWLYGSSVETGYGSLSYLFSLSHVLPNLARYPYWLVDTHSLLMLGALAAPLLVARGWTTPSMSRARALRVAWSALVMFAALLAFYTLYFVFDDWTYIRFLLPALPPVFALAVLAPLVLLRRASGPLAGGMVLALLLLIASAGFVRSRVIGAFSLVHSEQRYVDVATFARGLEPTAIFATMMHSGSLHYYTARPILRWDWVEPPEIDRAMDALRAAGHDVYVVLDDWEEPGFRSRFAGTRTLSSLGRPLLTTTGPSIHTSVYRAGP